MATPAPAVTQVLNALPGSEASGSKANLPGPAQQEAGWGGQHAQGPSRAGSVEMKGNPGPGAQPLGTGRCAALTWGRAVKCPGAPGERPPASRLFSIWCEVSAAWPQFIETGEGLAVLSPAEPFPRRGLRGSCSLPGLFTRLHSLVPLVPENLPGGHSPSTVHNPQVGRPFGGSQATL